jgi:flagellar biosynthesis/type III secretory pathway chaperone
VDRLSRNESSAAELERAAARLLPIVVELEQALAAEAAALSAHDADALLFAAEAKRRCLHAADAHLAKVSLAPLPVGPRPDENRADHEAEAAELPGWHELLARLTRCRQMNQAAGAAIAALRSHNDASLRLLGLTPEPASYGSSGRPDGHIPAHKRAVC